MALKVKKSLIPGAGKGLFTTKAIKKGEQIIEYLGEIIEWNEYKKRVDKDQDGYLFFINRKCCIDAFNTPQHIARYANDAAGLTRVKGLTNNSEYVITDKTKCFVVAKKNINAGDEILVSYSKDYWKCVRYNLKLKERQNKIVSTLTKLKK
jgi:hypothetical protein